MVRGYFKCTKFPCKFILGKNLSVAALFEYCFQEHKQLANINSWLCRPYLHSNNWLKAILKKAAVSSYPWCKNLRNSQVT